jgi:hypothetical protein
MTADIEVIDLKRIQNAGNIRGVVSVRVGGVTLIGCKVVQQVGQKPWIALPDREWVDDDGKKRWTASVKLSTALKQRLDDAVFSACRNG